MDATKAMLAPETAPAAERERRWSDIERSMESARDLRSAHCAGYLAAPFRFARRALARRDHRPEAAWHAGALGAVLVLALTVMPDRASAQEVKETRLALPSGDLDRERLAALGITSSAIEEERNVEALWRAVRELVLPGHLSVPMQQRILRRVWLADPEIRDRPAEDSTTN